MHHRQYLILSVDQHGFIEKVVPMLTAVRRHGLLRILDIVFFRRSSEDALMAFGIWDLPQASVLLTALDVQPGEYISQADKKWLSANVEGVVATVLLVEQCWLNPLYEVGLLGNCIVCKPYFEHGRRSDGSMASSQDPESPPSAQSELSQVLDRPTENDDFIPDAVPFSKARENERYSILWQLAELKKCGVLTVEEFQRKKQRLLR